VPVPVSKTTLCLRFDFERIGLRDRSLGGRVGPNGKNQSEAIFGEYSKRGGLESEITMPISDAKEYIEAARSVGLVVLMFS
jgi:hypothetical protein